MKRLLLLLVALACAFLSAQTPDPSTLPLVQAADIQYQGGFRMPFEAFNGVDMSYGGFPIAFNPVERTLFVGSWNNVTEVSIPSTLGTGANEKLFPQSVFVQKTFADPTEGHFNQLTDGSKWLGGMLSRPGRLFLTGYVYYDGNGTAPVSHFARSTNLATPSFSGWSRVWDRPGYVAGYMTEIPPEHQARLGGTALTGQCCLSVVSRTSLGPSAFAFDPTKIGQAQVDAVPLLYYPATHPTLGNWDASNPTYGASTSLGGVVIPRGTRTALFFGRNGMGEYCYGEGTSDPAIGGTTLPDGTHYCYDPESQSKGQHMYPYRYQVWAYDLNDFVAVKEGRKQPWEIVPYGVWPLAIQTKGGGLGGVTVDEQTGTIYLSQLSADILGCCGVWPVMHALKISIGTIDPPPPPPPPPVIDPKILELEARIAAIKALVQQALTAAPKNTATRVTTPLKSALTK